MSRRRRGLRAIVPGGVPDQGPRQPTCDVLTLRGHHESMERPSMGARGLAELTELDHYTLVARSARQSAEFHVNILGFKLLRIQELNTGTLPEGQVDML